MPEKIGNVDGVSIALHSLGGVPITELNHLGNSLLIAEMRCIYYGVRIITWTLMHADCLAMNVPMTKPIGDASIRGRLLRALIGLSHDIAQIYQWNHPFACDPR